MAQAAVVHAIDSAALLSGSRLEVLAARRFVFVLDGLLMAAEGAAGSARLLHAGDFAYIPPDSAVRSVTQTQLACHRSVILWTLIT